MDQEARDSAADALSKISAHETLCAERWKNSKEASDRIEAGLKDLRNAVNRSVGIFPASLIGILMGAVGFLAERAFHP